jgi:hypothetical protein
MKKEATVYVRCFGLLVLLGVICLPTHASPFRNLGFDEVDAYSVSDTSFGERLSWWDLLIPGWELSSSDMAPGQTPWPDWRMAVDEPSQALFPIVYTTNTSAHVLPSEFDPVAWQYQPVPVVVQGRNSLMLWSRLAMFPTLLSISQTGDIPPDTKSLRFLNFGRGIDVYINGLFVPSVYRPRLVGEVPAFDVVTDISAFSGQTVELRLTTANLPKDGVYWHGLDSVAFSSEKLPEAQVFTPVTEGGIVQDTGAFNTCAWAEVDNAGFSGVFTGNQSSTNGVLYRSKGDGTFTPILFGAGESCTGAHWGDYNNDGFVDLLRTFDGAGGGIRLQINGGQDLDLAPLVQGSASPAAASPAAADFDNDGRLDFVVFRSGGTQGDGLYVYRNLGGTRFQETRLSEAPPAASLRYAPVCGDYDNDRRADIFVAVDGGLDFLLHNRGGGNFERLAGAPFGQAIGHSVAAAWGDYDNDGFLDLVVVSKDPSSNALFHNNGDGTFSQMKTVSLGASSAGSLNCAWGDYDNDGFLDLFIVNRREPNSLYRNNGDGSFSRMTLPELLNSETNSTSCAWSDYDNDGSLDLFVSNFNPNSSARNDLYRNNGSTNCWLKLRCFGTLSNRSAIGTRVRLGARVSGRLSWQMREISGGNGRSQNDLAVSFGLGDARTAELLRIEWPSGLTQEFPNVSAKQALYFQEPALGLLNPELSHGQFQATILGRADSPKTVQASPDLRQWTTVAKLTNFTGRASFLAPMNNGPQQFYRVIEE